MLQTIQVQLVGHSFLLIRLCRINMITITITQGADVQKLIGELSTLGISSIQRENMLDIQHTDFAYIKTLCNAYMPQPSADELAKLQMQQDALTNYSALTAWAKTGTAAKAETYINGQIFNGQNITQVNTYIDTTIKETLIVNITTANVAQINVQLANIRTQIAATRIVFKAAAGAIIAMRDLFILTSKLLIYIRDLVIRFRT